MCQTTRSRVCSVSCPSQSASSSASTGQASRLVSAMRSALRPSSNRAWARVTRACARLQDTPSAMARSLSYRSCLKLSSMASRSRGFRSARMERIRVRSSACPSGPSSPYEAFAGSGGGTNHAEWHGRVEQLRDRIGSRPDRAELHRWRSGRLGRQPDRAERYGRVGRIGDRLGRQPDRAELYRRVGRIGDRLGRQPDRAERYRRVHRLGSRPRGPPRPAGSPPRPPHRGPPAQPGASVGIGCGLPRTATGAAWSHRTARWSWRR